MQFSFETQVVEWRGPAPFFFAPVPHQQGVEIRLLARRLTYGWGMIPVEAVIGGVTFRTSLFPKDNGYLLPLKDAVRRKVGVTAGDLVAVDMSFGARA